MSSLSDSYVENFDPTIGNMYSFTPDFGERKGALIESMQNISQATKAKLPGETVLEWLNPNMNHSKKNG